jgi:hypothetical protein
VVIDRIETGALAAMGVVLLPAATAKLRTRPLLAALELAAAALAFAAPSRPAAIALAGLFAAFAAVHARHLRAGRLDPDCDCLGEGSGPSDPRRALALTAGMAIVAITAAITAPPSPARLLSDGDALPVLLGALAGLGWLAAFAGATPGEQLVSSSAAFLERRISRRSAIARLAVAGSALAVAPLRYLLYPVSAMAAIVPGDCGGGLCTDGYTAFCCEIHEGLNTCPSGTYPGGWWKCTDYTGRQLCSEQGVRYYVDCNNYPNQPFPGGCRCANDDCNERRVACNIFRYGQCNPQVPGTTAVVCRMVVCENPSTIPGLNCNGSLAVDDAVCAHEAPCLEPPAVELAGAGGV